MAEPTFTVDQIAGTCRLVSTQGKDASGNTLLGGYAIYYDRHGLEIERTENVWNVVVGFHLPQDVKS